MGLRAESRGWKAGTAAAVLFACGIAGAAGTKTATGKTGDQLPQMTPAVRIPVGALGYMAPSPAYLSLRFALTTVDFIDDGHLLFTFHVNKLMRRIPGDDATDNDQVIHAEVVDIATGKVTGQADWRMRDRQRYLWPLNDGYFMVRQKNSLFLTDSKLELHPYLTFDKPLQAVVISPDRQLMLLELQKLIPAPQNATGNATGKGPSLLGTGPAADGAGITVQAQKHVELVMVRPGDKTVIAESESPHIVNLPLNDDGIIEPLEGKEPNQWVLRKAYFSGKPKEFGMVRSTCMPELQPLSETVVLAIHCSANRTAGNKVVSALSTQGGTLWKDEWQDKYVWPSFAYATDGSRFAYESLELNRPLGGLETPDVDSVKGQPVGVFDTESGKLELVLDASPVLTGGSNYALSADGRRFAILRGGALEVYDLPPVPPPVEKKGKKK